MINYRTYKYLIKPTATQKEIIRKNFECCTFVYNKYLDDKEKGIVVGRKAKDLLVDYKKENEFLLIADSSALMNVLFKLQDNRINTKMFNAKKHLVNSYTTSNLSGRQAIYFVSEDIINIPKLGNVKVVMHRQIPKNSEIFNVTITLDNINNYYICIAIRYENEPIDYKIDITNSIGLDYSQPHMFVDSNGNELNMPRFSQRQENRIARLKNALQKTRRGSKNYYETKYKIGKLYKKAKNQRLDYLHKLSNSMANNYDVVCVEDLNMNEIGSKYNFAKNTYENSYGMFLQFLKYKLEEKGKLMIKVDRYFPSSRKCSVCGYVNNNLYLNDRTWICPKCNTKHNRDMNAAINIRNRGIQEFTSIGYLDQAYKIGSIPH